MLSKEKIENELRILGIEPPRIVFYDETDSTNTRAKEYARENPENRQTVVFIADSQTGGRGRRGRSFVSRAGSGIYMSILTYPDSRGADATACTARAAVDTSRAVERLCDCRIGIKWVNDLYLGGKKLAGILTEGEMGKDGKIAFQVVGMGINVYKYAISEEIKEIATSIEDQLGCAPNRSALAAAIIYESLLGSDHFEEYKSRSILIGSEVTVIKLTESYPARVLGINPDYSLKISRDGIVEDLFTGEVSLRI